MAGIAIAIMAGVAIGAVVFWLGVMVGDALGTNNVRDGMALHGATISPFLAPPDDTGPKDEAEA